MQSQPKFQTSISSYFSKPKSSKLQLKKNKSDVLENDTINVDERKVAAEEVENKKVITNVSEKQPLPSSPKKANPLQLKNNTVESKIYNFTPKKIKFDDDMSALTSSPKKFKLSSNMVSNQFEIKFSPKKIMTADTTVNLNSLIHTDIGRTSSFKDDDIEIHKGLLEDLLFDDLCMNSFLEENEMEILDLSQWQRCIIIDVTQNSSEYILKLKSAENTEVASCIVTDFWTDIKYKVDHIVSIIAIKKNDGRYYVTNQGGYIVLWPDNLLSGTEIVNSLFCSRRSILQDRFRGVDSGSKSMLIGTLVHEIFQICLNDRISTYNGVKAECKSIIEKQQFLYMLYDVGMTETEAMNEMEKFIPNILKFITCYVRSDNCQPTSVDKTNKKWDGTINDIVDIEENIWSPKYGISGRIDVTVKVTLHKRGTNNKIMPLELKTGKASNSAEHRGQVILYTMLMTEILNDNDKLENEVNEGLLLYLRDSIDVQEVSANYSEKRDLILLRNKLSYYYEEWRNSILLGVDELGHPTDSVSLPDPINHHSACEKCPYLTLCSIYLSKKNNDLPNNHLLIKLKEHAISHLLPEDIDYFMHWSKLLVVEDNEKFNGSQRKDLWKMSPSEREEKGKCLSNMILTSVVTIDTRFEHTFKKLNNKEHRIDIVQTLLQTGDYIVVSTNNKYGEASGTIVKLSNETISVLLNRNLTKRNSRSTIYNLDGLDSQSLLVYNLTNLGLLMDNIDASNKLRRIIIDRKPSLFNDKISKKIIERCKDTLCKLNTVQQRAILKSLTAEDFLLIRGMPGTGKTQTLVTLVEMLVKLNMSILITSHTHSAVDNIFLKLKDKNIKMLRLGSSNKIHKNLHPYTETELMKQCNSTDALKNVFDHINVVGVTCLGSNHPLLNKRTFDVCVVDESTQVLQCSVIRPLLAAKKFILFGDPDQLPPVVRSAKAKSLGLEESLFSRLNKSESSVSLTLQYRMNKTIMQLANRLTYNGQLQCPDDTIANSTLILNPAIHKIKELNKLIIECLSPSLKDSVVFIDTGNTYYNCNNINFYKLHNIENFNDSKYNNVCETLIVLNIIRALLKGSVQKHQIGVIAPYRDQIAFLNKVIKPSIQSPLFDKESTDQFCDESDVEINTVDQYQGRDKDIIIYSCVKTYPKENIELKNSNENQILEDKRRLTVAITRAKKKLIVIGDVTSLQRFNPFRELFGISSSDEHFGKFISIPEMEVKNEFSWGKII